MPILFPNHTSLATQCDTFAFEFEKQKKTREKFEMFKYGIKDEGIALDDES
jgi:hypothetical protein